MKFPSVKSKGKTSIPVAIAISLGICLLITFAGIVITTTLISKEAIRPAQCNTAIHIIHFISALVGTLAVNGIVKGKMVPVSAILSVAYLAILLAITAVFLGGQYSNVLTTLIMVLSGCIASIGLLLFIKKGQKKGIPKHAYR